jgi:phosphatidate cytidylyltransferase
VPGLLYLIAVGGIPYLATVVVLILLGTREFYQMIEAKGAQPIAGFGMAAAAALPIVAYLGNEYHATILMTAALLAVMVGQLTKAQIGEALASISGTFFGVFYVGWLLSHAVVLRFFHDVIGAKWGSEAAALVDPNAGAFYMVFTAACVVLTDAGAYFAGRAYGRRKLAPKISPSKTVEGAAGGVVVGTLGGLAFKALFDVAWPALSAGFEWSAAFLFAATLSVVGTIGDLVESLLKRDAQTKDTGTLLPGMGGILDRIDSSLLAIPVMYYMLLAYVYLRVG